MEFWRPPWKSRAQFDPALLVYFQQPMSMALAVEMQRYEDAVRLELDLRSLGRSPAEIADDGRILGPTSVLMQRMWDLRECGGYMRKELARIAHHAAAAQRAAFAMGLHSRLGEASWLNGLPPECTGEIMRLHRAAAAADAQP